VNSMETKLLVSCWRQCKEKVCCCCLCFLISFILFVLFIISLINLCFHSLRLCLICSESDTVGGINIATNEYLQCARELCTMHGAMLIFDEVQTGMGRTGRLWGCQHSGMLHFTVRSESLVLFGIECKFVSFFFPPRISDWVCSVIVV
jgi:hypothetical protein